MKFARDELKLTPVEDEMEIQSRYLIEFFGHSLFGGGAKSPLLYPTDAPLDPVWRNGLIHFKGLDSNLEWPHWSAFGFRLYLQDYIKLGGIEFTREPILLKTYYHPEVICLRVDRFHMSEVGSGTVPSTPWEILKTEETPK